MGGFWGSLWLEHIKPAFLFAFHFPNIEEKVLKNKTGFQFQVSKTALTFNNPQTRMVAVLML